MDVVRQLLMMDLDLLASGEFIIANALLVFYVVRFWSLSFFAQFHDYYYFEQLNNSKNIIASTVKFFVNKIIW